MALRDGSATAVDKQPQGRGDSDKQPREWRQAALGVGARRQPRRVVAAAAAGARDGQPRGRRAAAGPPRAAVVVAEGAGAVVAAGTGSHGSGGSRDGHPWWRWRAHGGGDG